MTFRSVVLTAVSLSALSASFAWGQTAPDASAVEEIVVTGTRTVGRSRLDTIAPVDVVTAKSLEQRGTTELATALANSIPSIVFPRPSNTDGTDAIRPAALRGQGPDQTLVLVNGARRHVTALVNTNGSVGRGSAAADLNAIPSTALERIEVLRDGAAAQYGSDAIAGVINLRLREADHGGGATVTYGQTYTEFRDEYADRNRGAHDGRTVTVAGWQGLKLGSDGFLTLSAEYRDREPTNRSGVDPRLTPNRRTSRFGDAEITDLSLYANAGKPLANGWEAYGWAGYQQRDGSSSATYRLPTDASQNIPSVYPDGYLPLIETDTEDLSIAGGVRGEAGGWRLDSNLVFGRNEIEFGVSNTINPSLGPTSPTSFKAGGVYYDQLAYKFDAAQEFEVGLAGPLNVALGLEARRESYKINPGEPGSYIRGPFTTLALGSRGFTGFTPGNAVDVDRNSVGVYADLEGKLTDKLTASAALRYENYSDFGENVSGKLAARYDFTSNFALRAAASTGFRAPSLQQQYFTSTAIVYINGQPFETGTYPSLSAAGRSLGGTELKAETAKNYSLGLVWRNGPLELTVDAYRIDVDDRIILSETLTGSATAAIGTNARTIFDLLSPYNASAARFFINGVNTETEGLDAVLRYRLATDNVGSFDFTLAGNVNNFDVTKTPTTTVLPQPQTLFGRQAVLRFENGTPPWRVSLQTDWTNGPFSATGRLNYYGNVLSPGSTADGLNDSHTGEQAVFDLQASYRLPIGATVSLGADNLFDVYPDAIPRALNTTGAAPFSSFSPFGFNGRYLYGRVSINW